VLRSSGEEKKAVTAPTPPTSALVRPFTVSISDSEIEDVKQRLARTRWPDPETVGDWSQGVRVANARSLAGYWEREYDWRRFESELNGFPQFLTEIDGLDIHFIHVRSKNPDAMPFEREGSQARQRGGEQDACNDTEHPHESVAFDPAPEDSPPAMSRQARTGESADQADAGARRKAPACGQPGEDHRRPAPSC